MENKKPRLELLSESDYETDSETDSDTSSSNVSSSVSSLVRSSSLPSLSSSATPVTTSNVPPFPTPNPPALAIVAAPSPAISNALPFTIPKIQPFTTSNMSYSTAAKVQSSAFKILPPVISIASSTANPTVLPTSIPSNPNLSSTATSNMPTPPTENMPTSASGGAHDAEQLRASFRSACEEINQEIIMQPLKTKQQTLKAIEDYLVVLSKQATLPFKIDLTDDSNFTKVSLKVDKNKVTVLSQSTPNQEETPQAEGAAASSDVPGSSRIVPNSGGAYWMPPVNPFTSSVTLRQHLEAASNNNIRPRRVRPPPGFHPTPQYNTTNVGVSASGGEGKTSSPGVVRPPPGFHGIAGHGPAIPPGSSNVQVPGQGQGPGPVASNTSAPGYYGLLDTQAIIDDLYRQSLSVVRQNTVLATPQLTANNFYAAANPDQLLYTIVPRQMAELERRPSSSQFVSHGGYREPPATPTNQYGYAQPQGAGNDLWQHFSNAAAAAASGASYIGGGGAGYWDDFLQKEVYDNFTSDQNSDLWKQFEEYQRVHYAPGSLRTGSTIFSSDNTGPSKHGPIGSCRPRSQTQTRGRPIENISIQRNIEQLPLPLHLRHAPNMGCNQMMGQQHASQQDVLTLSERFKNAAISNPQNPRPPRNDLPQTRNALLGALLQKRLKERAAGMFSGTSSTNATMNFPATTAAAPSSANMNANTYISSAVAAASGQGAGAGAGAAGTTYHMNNTINSALVSMRMDQLPCSYCMQNNKAGGCPTHVLRDGQGRTVCPVLRNKPCPICNKAGDKAHTVHECPIRRQWDMDDGKM